MINLRPTGKVLIMIVILKFTFPGISYSQDLNGIIKIFCLDGFSKEVKRNKTNINPELGEYVCDCFVKRINNNSSLESARETCKEEAIEKFEAKTI